MQTSARARRGTVRRGARCRLPQAWALVLGSALVVSGCSSASSAGDAPSPSSRGSGASSGQSSSASAPSSASSGSPSDAAIPKGVTLTEPGSQLGFGDPATVAYHVSVPTRRAPENQKSQEKNKGKGSGGGAGSRRTVETVLRLTVVSAQQGRRSDLAGFNLTDPYERRANYFYVHVKVANVGKQRVGGFGVPLLGISGKDVLLPPVRFTSAFARCPTEPLPSTFRPGSTARTCLVFLSPDRGRLAGVSYRPTETFSPIEWHGTVGASAAPRKKASGKGTTSPKTTSPKNTSPKTKR